VDFDDASSRQPAYAEGNVKADRAAGNSLDVLGRTAISQAHDRALAELLFYLTECCCECFLAILIHRISAVREPFAKMRIISQIDWGRQRNGGRESGQCVENCRGECSNSLFQRAIADAALSGS